MNKEQAFLTLNEHFQQQGLNVSLMDDWTITPFQDAFVFSPANGLRSNRLYMVRDDKVKSFSPATESIEEAYSSLV